MVGMKERQATATATSPKKLIDPQEVRRTLSTLFAPGQVFEIRVLEATKDTRPDPFLCTYGGYFNDIEAALRAIAPIKKALGFYVTLQECHPDLLDRAENKLGKQKKDSSTADKDITRYRWLPVDCDPERKSGISSTDEEHDQALQRAKLIRFALQGMGWPDPLEGDSGNGAHLPYRIDLENTPENADLLKRVLQGLAARFDIPELHIDQSVFNPARIWKLYGTLACKGDDTAKRPHRMSRLINVPDELVPVSLDLLNAIAVPAQEQPAAHKQPIESGNAQRSGDTPYGLKALDEECRKLASTSDGRRNIQLNKSAFAVGQLVAGRELTELTAEQALSHAGLQCGLDDNETKKTLQNGLGAGKKEPRSSPPLTDNTNGNRVQKSKIKDAPKPPEQVPPKKRKFKYASDVTVKPVEWQWQDRLARGCFHLAVGDPGLGKGLTTSKIIAQVTNGEPLPGELGKKTPTGVILMSPEDSDEYTIVPRLIAAGADLTKVLLLSKVEEVDESTGEIYERPVSFPEDAPILREAIEDAGASLVIIDPVLSMLSDRVDSHKNHAVRKAVTQVMFTAEKHNCAVLGVMHTTKTQHPNVLFRSSSSSAFIEIARSALFFVPDPDGMAGESGVIVNYKNNLVKNAGSIRYSIHNNEQNIGFIKWEGLSSYTRDELLNQATPTNNSKSPQENDVMQLLRENGIAMTANEIHHKLPHYALNAIEVMLKRKLEQGVVMRPSRGMYTYVGNHIYIPLERREDSVSTESFNSSVSSVSSVSFDNSSCDIPSHALPKLTETDTVSFDVSFKNGHNTASQEASQNEVVQTYKTDTITQQEALHIPQHVSTLAIGQWVTTADRRVGKLVELTEYTAIVEIYGVRYTYSGVQMDALRPRNQVN